MKKIFFILSLIFFSFYNLYAQNYYEIVVSEMVKNKKDFSEKRKLFFSNTTSGYYTDYMDVIPFVYDSIIIRELSVNRTNEIKNINISKRYSISKKKYNVWQFDNYVIIDTKTYITASLKYRNKQGGRNLLAIIENEKVIKIYNDSYVY